jgi:two-component system, chemotaxis family, chemotaxis protein CheY
MVLWNGTNPPAVGMGSAQMLGQTAAAAQFARRIRRILEKMGNIAQAYLPRDRGSGGGHITAHRGDGANIAVSGLTQSPLAVKRGGSAMQRRVLIVDDSMLMRRLVREALASDGWEIAGEAANGIEAVERYRQCWPDAVTLDITMPDCSGLTAVRRLLKIDPQARIVVVSALNQKKLTEELISVGACDFVVKPFSPEQLQDAMRASVGELSET